mgnify:CR=1 FL=1
MATTTITDLAILRLLQLSSAALPVGGFSFSQGLEYAIDSGWIENQTDIENWLLQQLNGSISSVDIPILDRQMTAAANNDLKVLSYWNHYALACRETSELRLTDTAMGNALFKLIEKLDMPITAPAEKECSFVTGFAMAASYWNVDVRLACIGFCWSWLENQVAAATKLVPLGQASAQRLLGKLQVHIPAAIDQALTIADDDIGASLPAIAMASTFHETQYSRLFRS